MARSQKSKKNKHLDPNEDPTLTSTHLLAQEISFSSTSKSLSMNNDHFENKLMIHKKPLNDKNSFQDVYFKDSKDDDTGKIENNLKLK